MSVAKSSIKEILFALVALLFLFAPVNFLVKVVMGILAFFTPMLRLIASKKGMPLTLLFLWCDFFEPLLRIQVMAMGFLSIVPVETIAVWGLAMYFALLPVAVLILKRWFASFCATLCKEF